MSWDVLLLRLPLSTKALSDLPPSYVPPPFGARDRVAGELSAVANDLEWVTTSFGVVRADDYVVEVDLGKTDPVDRILVHVQGADSSLHVVHAMTSALGARAVDCETDQVVDFDDEASSSGVKAWRARQETEAAADRESQKLLDAGEAVFPAPGGPKSSRPN